MASRSAESWKRKYDDFIHPQYEHVKVINPRDLKKRFQELADSFRDKLPTDGTPADPFLFSVHMTQFYRDMESAMDSYLRATLAWYAKRGSCGKEDSLPYDRILNLTKSLLSDHIARTKTEMISITTTNDPTVPFAPIPGMEAGRYGLAIGIPEDYIALLKKEESSLSEAGREFADRYKSRLNSEIGVLWDAFLNTIVNLRMHIESSTAKIRIATGRNDQDGGSHIFFDCWIYVPENKCKSASEEKTDEDDIVPLSENI